jgi:hypothetical protein
MMAGKYFSQERASANKIFPFFLGLGILLSIIGIYMLTEGNDYGLWIIVMGGGVVVISIRNLYAWNSRPKPRNEYTLSEIQLVKFLRPYQQITIEAIAEHFFPLAGIKFADYPDILHVIRAEGIVKDALEKLLMKERISGSVRRLDNVWYYIAPENPPQQGSQ